MAAIALDLIKEFINQLDKKEIKIFTADKGIKLHFNPPYGPHFGGVHETMIKLPKKKLYWILGSTDINNKELATGFAGTVDLVNLRPLTYQSLDTKD